MKGLLLSGALLAACATYAKDKPAYQTGVLLQMDSTSCGMAEKGGKTITGELLGTDGQHQKTEEVLCQEYILQSDRLIFRIRPRDDKHPVLLPIRESASSAYIKTSCYYGFRSLMAKSANILSSDIAGR